MEMKRRYYFVENGSHWLTGLRKISRAFFHMRSPSCLNDLGKVFFAITAQRSSLETLCVSGKVNIMQ